MPLFPLANWPDSHDKLRYLMLSDHFAEAFGNGISYPRWLPNAFGGFGYPTFVFYQPGFFFCTLPWRAVFDSTTSVIYATILSLTCLGALGAFLLCRELTDARSACWGAVLFLLTPYLWADLYVRGDLSELAAMLAVPWVLFCFVRRLRNIDAGKPAGASYLGLGLTIAAVTYFHPAVSLLLIVTLVLMTAYLSLVAQRYGTMWSVLGQSFVLAAAVSLPYWGPLFMMKEFVSYEGAINGYFTPGDHTVAPVRFFAPSWGYGLTGRGTANLMSLQLGLPHALLAFVGAIAMRRNLVLQGVFATYILLVLAITPAFAWLWNHVWLLRVVQFPWRVLAVTAALQLVAAMGIHSILPRSSSLRLGVLVLLTCLVANWHIQQFAANPGRHRNTGAILGEHRRELTRKFFTYAGADEFTPRTAIQLREFGPRGERPLVETVGGRKAAPAPGHSPYCIRYQVEAGPPTDVIINQAYFPGWRILLNGEVVPRRVLENHLNPEGRIRIPVASVDRQHLVAYYDGPPGAGWRVLAMSMIFLFFIVQWRHDLTCTNAAAGPRLLCSVPAVLLAVFSVLFVFG